MTDWIAVDWGTTRLRAWGMTGDAPDWHESSDRGMGNLRPDQFEGALRDLLGPRARGTVVACGMVGSRQGWAEAPYRAVPCAPLDAGARTIDAGDMQVHILPGLKQETPPDVMRGEETQIAGLLAREPKFDGVALLPGTHSKWAHLSAEEVVSFRTFLTGEMFALLETSTLRHSLGDWDEGTFDEAVSTTLSRPERLASDLFAIRADHLLNGRTGRARLSGLLIGAELAAAKPFWLGREIAIVGDAKLSAAYARALAAQGVPTRTMEADALTLAGLTAAHRRLDTS